MKRRQFIAAAAALAMPAIGRAEKNSVLKCGD
jgi:hypothetical protein